jgi:glyceraldehyde 3-phosphate dehydrogenase
MAIKVGINGFGRIGRNILRTALNDSNLEFVAVNDLTDPKTLAHLLKYDSILGNLQQNITAGPDCIKVGERSLRVFAEKDPAKLDWESVGAQVVIESTGRFTNAEDARKHLRGPVKKVIISAPAKNEDFTVVLGVNEQAYDAAKHHVISNASCTTNCLAPMAKVIHDTFTIERGLMTTIHAYTQDQNLQDGPHSDLRRARAAALNIVPTSTGAAKAIGLVLPELKGKLDGVAIRVPTPNVSVIDFKFMARRATTKDEINGAVKRAAEQQLKGILGYTEAPNVSSDFNHDAHSSVFAIDQTKVMDGTLVRVMSWYDNEWGFSNRMVDTAVAMGKLI